MKQKRYKGGIAIIYSNRGMNGLRGNNKKDYDKVTYNVHYGDSFSPKRHNSFSKTTIAVQPPHSASVFINYHLFPFHTYFTFIFHSLSQKTPYPQKYPHFDQLLHT